MELLEKIKIDNSFDKYEGSIFCPFSVNEQSKDTSQKLLLIDASVIREAHNNEIIVKANICGNTYVDVKNMSLMITDFYEGDILVDIGICGDINENDDVVQVTLSKTNNYSMTYDEELETIRIAIIDNDEQDNDNTERQLTAEDTISIIASSQESDNPIDQPEPVETIETVEEDQIRMAQDEESHEDIMYPYVNINTENLDYTVTFVLNEDTKVEIAKSKYASAYTNDDVVKHVMELYATIEENIDLFIDLFLNNKGYLIVEHNPSDEDNNGIDIVKYELTDTRIVLYYNYTKDEYDYDTLLTLIHRNTIALTTLKNFKPKFKK